MSEALFEAAEVRILRLQPGDEIVLTIQDGHVSAETAAYLRQSAEARWPEHKVTVLYRVDMEVVRA